MLSIRVVNERQDRQVEHAAGPLEFGRGPQQQVARCVVEDPFASRDHLQIEELPSSRLRVKNLSAKQPLAMPAGAPLGPGATCEVDLPVALVIGKTTLEIDAVQGESFDADNYETLARPARPAADRQDMTVGGLGEAPSAEKVAQWLETIIVLQRTTAGSREFYNQTARALVDLVGLDLGMVLLRGRKDFDIAGHHSVSSTVSSRYSRTLMAHVLQEKRTFFQSLKDSKLQAESLQSLDAVVASPIFGLNDDIPGVLYGVRTYRGRGGIKPLEAQIVQLLAGALGANLVRSNAIKTRTQFEQFFSPELVRELERDPNLLEGRNQELTVLFGDIRGFTPMSEKLGPELTCRVVRSVMERLTDRIVAHGGAVVDYAGDGILAMWNAPVPQTDHAARACRAALAMLAELPELNKQWQGTVPAPLAIGVGINTGPALVGNTGSTRRLKYGPFGMTVNVASRIQDATKKVGTPLLISGSVRDKLPGGFQTRSVGGVPLAGVTGDVELFALSGEASTLTETQPYSEIQANKH